MGIPIMVFPVPEFPPFNLLSVFWSSSKNLNLSGVRYGIVISLITVNQGFLGQPWRRAPMFFYFLSF
jgi:hypothetical protein